MRDELQAITNSKNGQAAGEDGGVGLGGVGVVDGRRAAGEDDASASGVVQGSTTEKTLNSRMRRAMSCVYCEPKSRMTMVELAGGVTPSV